MGVIRFKMSAEYVGDMTLVEFRQAMDIYAEERKESVTLTRNAMINALANFHRKEGDPVIELFEEKNEKTNDQLLQERFELFGY